MATPVDDTAPSGGNGNRSVSNFELKILSQEIGQQIALLALNLTNKLDNLERQMGQVNADGAALAVQVATNTQEIEKVRGHYHDLAGIVTAVKIKSEIMSSDARRELVQLLPYIKTTKAMLERRGVQDVMTPAQLALVQTIERELGEERVKTLADEVNKRSKDAARWYDLPREVIGAGVGISFLIIANHVDAIWHAFFH